MDTSEEEWIRGSAACNAARQGIALPHALQFDTRYGPRKIKI